MSARPPVPRPAAPIGFAHQGGRSQHAQNTLPAFALALEARATGLESDVWLTADGVPVLDHDGLSGGRPLRLQRRGDLPSHVSALGDLYALCGPEIMLSLDVRDPDAVAPVLAVARDAGDGAVANLWLCTEQLEEARAWRRQDDDVRIVHSTELSEMRDGVAAHLRLLRAEGVDVLNLHEEDWDEQSVGLTHEAGLLAFGWDAQTRQLIERLVAWGCDGVYSDEVGVLVDVLGRPVDGRASRQASP